MFRLMKAYANLDKLERAVIEALFQTEFIGTYSDLSRALQKPKGISNVRKAVLRLERKQIVFVDEQRNERGQKKQKKRFLLADNWFNSLI